MEARRSDDDTAAGAPRAGLQREGGRQSSLAAEALQQAGLLQSLPQHAGGTRQEGTLLCL